MNTVPQLAFLGKRITIKVIRDYILDVGLTDLDTIVMNQADFDELALEYRNTFQEHLPFPYLLLGVLIREEVKGLVNQGSVAVIENDTQSFRVDPNDIYDPYRVIYRCHNCGGLVGPNGEELDSKSLKQNADYLTSFGNKVLVQHERGYCCEHEWNPKPELFRPTKPKVDYSAVESKALMELTQEDFAQIGLSKGESPKFEVIYSCESDRLGKIYFTPNESSYSLRGHMLLEQDKVFTTEQLIKAVRNWRED